MSESSVGSRNTSKTTFENIREDELDRDVVAEIERYACVSILFLIYAAVFALCQLVPHASAQLVLLEDAGGQWPALAIYHKFKAT